MLKGALVSIWELGMSLVLTLVDMPIGTPSLELSSI